MSFYSPFVNAKGQQLPLPKLRFSYIDQLEKNQIEEGYKVEYKSTWDRAVVNNHLCKTIVSFANTEGGWLIIGIDNEGKYIGIDKPRSDFSQTISQKLSEKVSPIPQFECRFLSEPGNKKRGVLVIYIREGTNPPYIVDGTVYVRSGSSKVPIKPGRLEIDHLIQRREQWETKQREFCKNDFVTPHEKFAYCTVYLYRHDLDKYTYGEKFQLQNTIKNFIQQYFDNQFVSSSTSSVLCYGSPIISKKSYCSIEEYFVDGNAKLFIPMIAISRKQRDDWAQSIFNANPNIDLREMAAIDGYVFLSTLQQAIYRSIEVIQTLGFKLEDYTISVEYKNVFRTALYFKASKEYGSACTSYIEDLHSGNAYICPKTDVFISSLSLTHKLSSNSENIAFILACFLFSSLYGMDPNMFQNIYFELHPYYTEKYFSSDFDWDNM